MKHTPLLIIALLLMPLSAVPASDREKQIEARCAEYLEWIVENFGKLAPIQTGDAPCEHLYTNATIRYERAPDYLLMFPSRFASAREPKPGWKFGKGVNDVVSF